MRDEEEEPAPPTLISIPSPTKTTPLLIRKSESTSYSSPSKTARQFVVKNRYKFWALAAILLLAFWSMFTGSVTLKWSASNLTTRLSADDDLNLPTYDDLDILEVEEREKVVRHLWDLYTQQRQTTIKSSGNRLPRFWQEAFEAAYDPLNSDLAAVRNAAVSEIAKMSIHSSVLNNVAATAHPFPLPHSNKGSRGEVKKNNKMKKNTKESMKVTTT